MISQENCNFLFPWKDGFNPHHRSWQQQESRSRAQLLPSTLEASKKYSQRLAAMCLPIRLHHAYSTTQQELLYFFMDLMKEDVVLRRQAAPQLVSFLEDLNDEDLMWRNSAESGFAFHFLRKLLEVIMLDDDNRSDIIAFVVHKLSFLNLRQANAASQAASLQQQVEAILMPSEENAFDTLGLEGGEEGGIPLTSTTRNAESAPFQFTSKERGRFLLTQELFHTIASTAKTQLVDWSAHALTIVELAQETIGFVLPILIQEHNTQKHGANTSTAGSVVQCITGLVLQALAACYHMLRTLWNNSTKERNIKLEAFDAAFDLAHLVLGSSIHHVSKEVEKLSLLLEIQVTLYSMNQFHLDMCFQSIVRYLNSFPRDTLHQGLVSLCLSQEAESMEQRGGLMKLPSTASHTSSELEDILEVLQATLDILTNIYETNLSEFESRSRPVTTAVSKLLVEIVNMVSTSVPSTLCESWNHALLTFVFC